jgi:adenylate cyclase
MLTDYREEIAMLVRQHRGRVVDSPGDNLLAEFPSALDAVRGAVEIQRVIGVRNSGLPAERRMEFRIGVHMGDVTVEGDRIYGDGVNIAARLEGLAKRGGVCISGTVYEQVEKKRNVVREDLGGQTLRNISRPVHVYGVKLLLAEPEAEAGMKTLPGMEELTVPGFGGRPAIAVLPFENLSGDPDGSDHAALRLAQLPSHRPEFVFRLQGQGGGYETGEPRAGRSLRRRGQRSQVRRQSQDQCAAHRCNHRSPPLGGTVRS